MVDLAKYRKLVVAGSGFAVLLLGSFGLDTAAGADDQIVQLYDAVVSLLTTFGVYRVPNKGGTRGV
jgi:hypothetical protein